jgi:hypothetical protein
MRGREVCIHLGKKPGKEPQKESTHYAGKYKHTRVYNAMRDVRKKWYVQNNASYRRRYREMGTGAATYKNKKRGRGGVEQRP